MYLLISLFYRNIDETRSQDENLNRSLLLRTEIIKKLGITEISLSGLFLFIGTNEGFVFCISAFQKEYQEANPVLSLKVVFVYLLIYLFIFLFVNLFIFAFFLGTSSIYF
jgi:hypothetical protein